jgi:hypothetical protein
LNSGLAKSPESQFPTTAFALELFFGLRLGRCASAVRTLHGADLSHDFLPNLSFGRFVVLLLSFSALLEDIERRPIVASSIECGIRIR